LRILLIYVYYIIMENRISATELARSLGDILGRIRYRGESFTVMRNGVPVARLTPVRDSQPVTVGEAFAAWKAAIGTDPELADDLERVRAADRPPGNPWAS
jgi:antitoxin (DNA-binding transcriptional repressor) of toxin-antitoxin stability system